MIRSQPYALAIASILLLSGCSALKETVGEYEKEALVQAVSDAVDKKLAAHGLSTATLKAVADMNGDGKVGSKEVVAATASMAKELALIEAKKVIDEKIKDIEARSVSKNDLERDKDGLWAKLLAGALGLLSTYLGKQIVSGHNASKKHANYHARMAVLEAIAGKKSDEGDADVEEEAAPAAPKSLPAA